MVSRHRVVDRSRMAFCKKILGYNPSTCRTLRNLIKKSQKPQARCETRHNGVTHPSQGHNGGTMLDSVRTQNL